LKALEKREIVSLEENGDEIKVKVIDKNNIEILKYSLKEILNLKTKKKWNSKWFLVVFDVPEEQRNKRDYLRHFIRQIGFTQYQQSVYAYPYECEKEVEYIKRIVEGGKYISYIIADRLEHEERLKQIYNLT
jgi:CRISPR-associated endonuclease Cas2